MPSHVIDLAILGALFLGLFSLHLRKLARGLKLKMISLHLHILGRIQTNIFLQKLAQCAHIKSGLSHALQARRLIARTRVGLLLSLRGRILHFLPTKLNDSHSCLRLMRHSGTRWHSRRFLNQLGRI